MTLVDLNLAIPLVRPFITRIHDFIRTSTVNERYKNTDSSSLKLITIENAHLTTGNVPFSYYPHLVSESTYSHKNQFGTLNTGHSPKRTHTGPQRVPKPIRKIYWAKKLYSRKEFQKLKLFLFLFTGRY